jgi:hypothetical protein
MRTEFFFGLIIFAAANRLQAADFFVATSGDDGNGGKTSQTPFKTLAAACRVVPAGKNTIHIAPGVYEEKEGSVVPAGVSLVGAGAGKTVFVWKTAHSLENNPMEYDSAAFLIQATNSADASISGFTVTGQLPDDHRAHGGIVARNVRGFSIHDCELRGLEFCGVWLAEATNSSVHHCRYDDCAHPSQLCCSGALQIGQLVDCAIHDNVIREHRGAYGIKTWQPIYKKADDWYFLLQNKIRLARVKIYNNDIKTRQSGGWGSGQPNMNLELWNSLPEDCEIYSNRFNECVSLVEGADAPRTIRVHHNLFLLEPGYSYAIEAGHHNLEIDHNVFRNGFYPIASWGGVVRNLNVHDNTFDGIENIAVLVMPGVTDFRFVNNTVVVKQDMPLVSLGKFSNVSSNLLVANNLFVKEGGEPVKSKMVQSKEGLLTNVVVTNNAYWNWDTSEEKSAMVVDPGLERSPDGDHLLHFKPTSKALAAGIGNPADLQTSQ